MKAINSPKGEFLRLIPIFFVLGKNRDQTTPLLRHHDAWTETTGVGSNDGVNRSTGIKAGHTLTYDQTIHPITTLETPIDPVPCRPRRADCAIN